MRIQVVLPTIAAAVALSMSACSGGSPSASLGSSVNPTTLSTSPSASPPTMASASATALATGVSSASTVPSFSVEQTFHVGPMPIGLASSDGALWTATINGPTLVRLDPTTGNTQEFKLGSGQLDLGPAVVESAGSIWVIAAPKVVRFDPATLKVLATVDAGPDVYDLAASPDGVWFSEPSAGTISRIDAATNTVGPVIQVPGAPKELYFDGTSMWAASHTDGAVRNIDTVTGDVLATVSGLDQPRYMAMAANSLWVADLHGRIIQVDSAAAAVESAIQVAAEPFGMLSTSDSVLVSGSAGSGVVIEIDPSTAVVVGETKVGLEHLGQMRCLGGQLWLTDLEGGNIIELAAPVCS